MAHVSSLQWEMLLVLEFSVTEPYRPLKHLFPVSFKKTMLLALTQWLIHLVS